MRWLRGDCILEIDHRSIGESVFTHFIPINENFGMTFTIMVDASYPITVGIDGIGHAHREQGCKPDRDTGTTFGSLVFVNDDFANVSFHLRNT